MVKVEFSPAEIALRREVNNHPTLVELLTPLPKGENGALSGEYIGEIAAYCGITMDGFYGPADLEVLYNKLYWELRGARTINVNWLDR
jgi:hypothetical protein